MHVRDRIARNRVLLGQQQTKNYRKRARGQEDYVDVTHHASQFS